MGQILTHRRRNEMPTVAETIKEATECHLKRRKGLLFAQCVTAVGWIGGTVPDCEGIVELSMADVAGAGIAVGAALVGRRPIYVIRYQGFMWYDAAPLLNYAAKSKEMWGVPCPIFIRSIASEGAGPVAGGSHHGMVMRMPGIKVFAPMTPNEWLEGWNWFLEHDEPVYCSEHRDSFKIGYEMVDVILPDSKITLLAISAARLKVTDIPDADIIHVTWLKPFNITNVMRDSLKKTGVGLLIDSDFEQSGKSIAHTLMLETGVPVHVVGLEDRTAGFSKDTDNGTPSTEQIVERIKEIKCKS